MLMSQGLSVKAFARRAEGPGSIPYVDTCCDMVKRHSHTHSLIPQTKQTLFEGDDICYLFMWL